jgi:predicted acyl esterase
MVCMVTPSDPFVECPTGLPWPMQIGCAEPVTPGEVYEVTIPMWDTCVRLPAGHRVRVEIASSAFPKFDVNLGTGGDMVTETTGVRSTGSGIPRPGRPCCW